MRDNNSASFPLQKSVLHRFKPDLLPCLGRTVFFINSRLVPQKLRALSPQYCSVAQSEKIYEISECLYILHVFCFNEFTKNTEILRELLARFGATPPLSVLMRADSPVNTKLCATNYKTNTSELCDASLGKMLNNPGKPNSKSRATYLLRKAAWSLVSHLKNLPADTTELSLLLWGTSSHLSS